MQRITSEILSLERLDANGELHTELVDLNAMVEKVYGENQDAAEQKTLHYYLAREDHPVLVQVEPALLHEAMSNLISNAIKYTPNNGTVKVRLRQHDSEAVFQVMDTGYGIPEDQRERLFQPFYRVKIQESAEIDGTGLGLHLVKNIITRHDGMMLFESEYGQGSTFGFQLPLASTAG